MQKLNVSFLSGLITTRDAMSNVCRQHMEAIYAWGLERGYNVEVRIYAAKAEIHDSRIVEADSVASVIADDHFQKSQLVIGEFGCIFGLFDAIHFAPPGAKTVVCYHGITPPAVTPGPMAGALRASYRQAGAMLGVDQIITQSHFLKNEVASLGVDPARIAVVALPVAVKPPTVAATRKLDPEQVRLAYLGRIVTSKGVVDLVEAMRLLKAQSNHAQVRIMGTRRLSDESYLGKIEAQISAAGLGDCVKFKLDLSNQEVSRELADSDALVIPSYHEGFCVPVIEALNCGCFVLCSDRGSLPEVSAGLGRSFRAKDPQDLADKIAEMGESLSRGGFTTDRGFMTFPEWKEQVDRHLKTFDPKQCDAAFLEPVMRGIRIGNQVSTGYLADIRRDAIANFHHSPIKPIESQWAKARIQQILKSQGLWADSSSAKPAAARPASEPAIAKPAIANPHYQAPPTVQPMSPAEFPSRIEELMSESPEDFITGIYDLLLERFPEPDSMKEWIQSMKAGTPRIKIVEQIAFSSEAQSRKTNMAWLLHLDRFRYKTNYTGEIIRILMLPDEQFVAEAYNVLLGRAPDEQGVGFFMTQLHQGTHRMEIVRFIAHSEEGQRHIGDLSWLEKMPDVDNLIRLSKPLPKTPPAPPIDFATRIEELMPESPQKFIDGVYQLLLNRSPDPESLEAWIANLNAGTLRIQVVEKIACSDEARHRVANTDWLLKLDKFRYVPDYGNQIIGIIGLPDREFIAEAYRILLGRMPDKPSADFFLTKLNEGTHRMEVIRNLAHSEEGRRRLVDLAWLEKMPNVDDMIRMAKLRRQWRSIKKSLLLGA